MKSELIIVMAQINLMVGDIPGNAQRVIECSRRAKDLHQADLVVFPELTLSGYPPEDLLLRPSLTLRIERSLKDILTKLVDINVDIIIGYPAKRNFGGEQEFLYNIAAHISGGKIVTEYAKQLLPNYQVFDEKRYFEAGKEACVTQVEGLSVGLTICEDIWEPGPSASAREAGAKLLINLNASPYHREKSALRLQQVAKRAVENEMPILYVNLVGGQDELVFDGGSLAVDSHGDVQQQAPVFEEGLYPVCLDMLDGGNTVSVREGVRAPALTEEASVYSALVLGVRDYVTKNGFKGVVLGLSGGIDSALTLAIAVDALGSDEVEAIMMPFRYTSEMSIEDAAEEAKLLSVNYRVISIEAMYEAFVSALKPEFKGLSEDVTEQNIQARCRGVLLMAISNKKGVLVLTTGNKSEMAVGYSTLYGDMAGGFDVLKDVPKMLVYRLSRYRNTLSAVIPERVIERPPSAELAPDQVDEDNLPSYEILDQILEMYVEQDKSAHEIIDAGFAAADVRRVIRLVDINEYKRRQAPVGVRITQRGFGRDRRYPITSGWVMGD